MADTFKKLVNGKVGAVANAEWFSVPASTQYQGYVRVSNTGAAATYRIAGVAATGTVPTTADYEAYDVDLEVGDVHDLTMDLNALETLVIQSSTTDVVFNFRGLSIDVS
jgi:hypothetical protein